MGRAWERSGFASVVGGRLGMRAALGKAELGARLPLPADPSP